MVSQGVTLRQSAGTAACIVFFVLFFSEAGMVPLDSTSILQHLQAQRRADREEQAGSSYGIAPRHPGVFLQPNGRRLTKCCSNETLEVLNHSGSISGSNISKTTHEVGQTSQCMEKLLGFAILTGISAVLLSWCLSLAWCCCFRIFWRDHHRPSKDVESTRPGSSELKEVASAADGGQSGMSAPSAGGEAHADEQDQVSLDAVIPTKEDFTSVPGYWRNHGKLSFHEEVETRYVKEAACSLFNKTSEESFDIIKAHRIEDQSLWAKYVQARNLVRERSRSHCPSCSPVTNEHMRRCMRASLDDSVTEVILFHGTSAEKARGIGSTGFDLSFAGATGSRLGKGIYFAEKSAKSDSYTVADKDQVRAMLLCRVCLGKVNTMKRAGDGAKVLVKNPDCDSVVCKVGSYNEFVIFNPALCYPEFVVFYKRKTAE